jgi:hypothetical protein
MTSHISLQALPDNPKTLVNSMPKFTLACWLFEWTQKAWCGWNA